MTDFAGPNTLNPRGQSGRTKSQQKFVAQILDALIA